MTETLYSVFKASEGGFGQRLALELLRGEGIRAEPAPSPYVGQTGVIVYGGAGVQADDRRENDRRHPPPSRRRGS